MKKFFNFLPYTILLVFALIFAGCSIEEPLEVQLNEKETLTSSSVISQMLENTVSNDGSYDNIIDGSSCFDIRFPYTVSVHDFEVTIDSEDDLKIIEALFDDVDSDDDILEIIFPITITMADYTEITISGFDDLKEISSQCIEGGSDDDIECIDITYPVMLFTYNLNLEKTGAVTVESDSEMRRFFAGLTEADLISIEFPVVFEMFDGSNETVNNNTELADALEQAKEACDEDDDNDYNDDDFTKERLDSLLVVCPWLVKEIIRATTHGAAAAEEYFDYVLNFKDDGTVIARDTRGNMLSGEWETKVRDYHVKLTLDFEHIEVFSLEWFVYEIDQDRIKLHIMDDSGDKIILKKACEEIIVDCTEDLIKETLQNCEWTVSDGENEVLNELRIDFSNLNIDIRNPNGTAVDEGNWKISGTTLSLNDLSMEMVNYIGDWEIIECSVVRFKMKRGAEYLVIEKDCE